LNEIFCLSKNKRKWITEDTCNNTPCEFAHNCLERQKMNAIKDGLRWLPYKYVKWITTRRKKK